MASGLFTNAGIQYVNAQRGDLGVLTLVPGTGRQTLAATLTALHTPYQLNGADHHVSLLAGTDIQDEDGDVVAFSFEAVDAAVTALYSMTEFGVYNSANTLIAYVVAAASEIIGIKALNSALRFQWVVAISNTTAPTITVTNTIAGLGSATETTAGAVRLAADGDQTSTGAVAVNPAQVAAIAAAVAPTLTYATAAQINTGTVTDRPIAPDQLEASAYRRLFTRAAGSTTIPSGAKAGDWIGTEE